jgi:hypothetical protein
MGDRGLVGLGAVVFAEVAAELDARRNCCRE